MNAMTDRPTYTAMSAAIGLEAAWSLLDGRWKLLILFNLFGSQVKRFSELQRLVTGISPKVLTQQLRDLEADGLVQRIAHDEKPPRVEYAMTPWGQALCPALDALLGWIEHKPGA